MGPMRNAIIVHGMPSREEYYDSAVPSASSHHWLPWLAKQLLVRDIAAARPEMPRAFEPDYPTWRREFERFDVTPRTLLVGHSCGGGFLIRWLSEHPTVRVGRVVLVAPWVDPDRRTAPDFFDFALDGQLESRTEGLVIFGSDDDGDGILRSVAVLRDALPRARYREFAERGHFLDRTFPELLVALLT
jgi:predicted alpha/beta hydrolase family esterase